MLQYGVGMGRSEPITEIVGQVKLAEDLGYQHCTFIDSQALSRDSVVMMALAATNTSRIQIGQGVTQPFTRHMSVCSNAVATIDELSGGRAFLGMGAGASALGVLGKQPRSMQELEEAVKFFRDFTSGREGEWLGGKAHSEWIRRRIPVILGVDGPRSMRIAGRIADGVFIPGLRPELIEWRRKRLDQGIAEGGRKREDLDYWVRTMICVDDDLEYARNQVRSYAGTCAFQVFFGTFRWKTPDAEELRQLLPGNIVDEINLLGERYDWYQHEQKNAIHGADLSPELIDSFVMCGPPKRVVEQVQALKECGIDKISMTLYTIDDKKRAMRRFVEEVWPYVR